jgi:fructose-bisphosphate aldolase class II
MLSRLADLLTNADSRGYAVPAFNINNFEALKAIIAAAEAERSPVIVQTSEGTLVYGNVTVLAAMVRAAAEAASVPVALHLDHGKSVDTVRACLAAGYGSAMFDGSTLPYADNVAQTTEAAKLAHAAGASLEAELGAIAGMEDLVNVEARAAQFTDPAQAAEFVAATGCDALAVSIGTAHGAHKFKGAPTLDLDRLSAIDAAVRVPLVLHGASGISAELVERTRHLCDRLGDCARLANASGVPDDQVAEAVRRGVRKVNVDSDLRVAFTAGLRDAMLTETSEIDPRKLLAPAVALMAEVCRHKMQLLGSAGKA